MNRKKRSLVALIVGFIGLASLAQVGRFEPLYRADVVQLITSGMCVGVALGIVLWQRKPVEGKQAQSE